MIYGVLIIAIILALAFFIYATKEDVNWEKAIKALKDCTDRNMSMRRICEEQHDRLLNQRIEINGHTKLLEQLKKEVEILTVRQRTIEKKQIATERTVNVRFLDNGKTKGKELLTRAGVLS